VATAIGIGVVYWTGSLFLESMGTRACSRQQLRLVPDLVFAFIGGYLILRIPT